MLTALDPTTALGIREGLVAVAGAGGKKSILYALARTCPGRVAVTTTVNCPLPPAAEAFRLVVGSGPDLAARMRAVPPGERRVFFAAPGKRPQLLGGVDPAVIAEVAESGRFDLVLVKADGARRRLIKAPGAGEPVYPPGTGRVIYVVSAHALGRRPDSGIAHRPEQLAVVTGARVDAPLEPGHLVRLLTSESGALKAVEPGLSVVAVINRVDTPERQRQAREVARGVLASTDRIGAVALACMGERPPLIEVVGRE